MWADEDEEEDMCVDRPMSADEMDEIDVPSISALVPKKREKKVRIVADTERADEKTVEKVTTTVEPVEKVTETVESKVVQKLEKDTSTTNLVPKKIDQYASTSSLAPKLDDTPPVHAPMETLDVPESLSQDQIFEFQDSITVFGQFLIESMLSRQFKLREWALLHAVERIDSRDSGIKPEMITINNLGEMQEADLVGNQVFVNGVCKVVEKGLGDSREKVSLLALGLWSQFTSIALCF